MQTKTPFAYTSRQGIACFLALSVATGCGESTEDDGDNDWREESSNADAWGSTGGGSVGTSNEDEAGGVSAGTETGEDEADADADANADGFPWAGAYPGTIRLIGADVVCEGRLTIVVDGSGEFSGSGDCTSESLGSYGTYEADFRGSFSASGMALGAVELRSFSVDDSYALSGWIDDSGLRLDWIVDDIAIDGEFVSGAEEAALEEPDTSGGDEDDVIPFDAETEDEDEYEEAVEEPAE